MKIKYVIILIICILVELAVYIGYRWLTLDIEFFNYDLFIFLVLFCNVLVIFIIIKYMSLKSYAIHHYAPMSWNDILKSRADTLVTPEETEVANDNDSFWQGKKYVKRKKSDFSSIHAFLTVLVSNIIFYVIYYLIIK